MWFKNAAVYSVDGMPTDKELEEALTEHAIKPCPPHARFIYGWLDVIPGQKVFTQNGAMLFLLGKEERILPPSVIKQMVDEKIKEIEERENRTVRRSERNQLKEEMEFTLLPKAFTLLKQTWAFFDAKSQRLVINSASAKVAEDVCAMLVKALKSVSIQPLTLDTSISGAMSDLLMVKRRLPSVFNLGSRCVLESPKDTSKRFTCKGYELPAEEVDGLLNSGLKAIEVAFEFEGRLSFSLTNSLVIKGIKVLDQLQDELKACHKLEDHIEVLDASFFLLTSELDKLINAITNQLFADVSTAPQLMHQAQVSDSTAHLVS